MAITNAEASLRIRGMARSIQSQQAVLTKVQERLKQLNMGRKSDKLKAAAACIAEARQQLNGVLEELAVAFETARKEQ